MITRLWNRVSITYRFTRTSQADTIIAKQMKGLRRIMRPLKARGKEWVHGLNSNGPTMSTSSGGGGNTVSRLGRPRQGSSAGVLEEDVDSDGSDLVRMVWFVVGYARNDVIKYYDAYGASQ